MVAIRYFAAAADAAGTATEVRDAATLGALLADLRAAHGERFAAVLGRCTLLLDGVVTSDPEAPLGQEARLDVLPPFAGG